MSISDNYVPIRQLGNGVTTQFSASWSMLSSSYARVYLEAVSTGVQTLVTEGGGASQYTISIGSSGFTVTFNTAPTSSYYVVIGRDVALDQTDPYRTSKGFQGEVLEGSLDKLTAIVQDIDDSVARSLSFPLGDTTSGALPSAASRANTTLIFDSSGAPTVGSISTAAVSAAMAPVLSSTPLSSARTAMGLPFIPSGHGADIASASTVNLDAATGDYVYSTGTTTWNAVTLAEGREVTVKYMGVQQITAGASLIPPGNATYITSVGDCITYRGEASGVVRAVGYLSATKIGEYVSATQATGSPIALTSATTKSITSISLTAGEWDVSGVTDFVLTGATVTQLLGGSSSTNNTIGSAGSYFESSYPTTTLTAVMTITNPVARFSLSSTTTIYLIARSTFSAGTVGAAGTIRARRVA